MPVYATFGFGFFDRGQLAEAAKLWVSQGFTRLKMTVGMEALRKRDQRPMMEAIREDEARIRAVREAVGPAIELFIDANCSLDYDHAAKLCEMIAPYRISFFEEPLTQNDALQMAALRRQTGMALACGQNEGLLFRFRDLLVHQAIDYAQPNVTITGGFTQCVKSPHSPLRSTFRSPMAVPGRSTTCTCRPASRTALWSNCTISQWSCANKFILICPVPKTATSPSPRHPALVSRSTATRCASSQSCRCRRGEERDEAGLRRQLHTRHLMSPGGGCSARKEFGTYVRGRLLLKLATFFTHR